MTTRYNYDRADYPLLQAIRMRRGVLSWGLGLTAWALLLGSTLIAEEHDNRLHWVRTGLLTAALPIAALGRLAVEDSVKAGRVLLDYEDVTDAGRQQLLWHETTDEVQQTDAIDEAAPVEMVDAWEYFGQAAKDWRTHLAMLSPTDTGKSSFLYLLFGAMAKARPTVLQAIEGKGAKWAGVPPENICRIQFRPTIENAHQLCYRLHKVLNLIQARVDLGENQWEGPQLVTVLEEYLTLSTGLKKRKGAFEPYGLELEISVEAMAGVARGGGGQLVVISQSPNAEDLKFSGGVRQNFRIACLGSRFGGFDAIENMIGNFRFVNARHRDRIEAEYQASRKLLYSDRHPIVLTNLMGEWRCFPLPYLDEKALASLTIDSLPVPPELIEDDGWLPGIDEIGSSDPGPSQPAAISRPQPATTAIEPDDDEKLNLEAIEGIIFEVLAGASEPLKAHEIKAKRRPLRSVDKDLFAKILEGLTERGDLLRTDEENPGYSLPPNSILTERG
ncbi:hypothetical protein VB780_02040 [Leptolyngbya sp. CCNP1308]|uniref:hypothetical protein n=1 Tax=Leptolyngbya sp. CCNP1308 TaxID=3110255 RepID=UPI002B206A66|nr:hypothetical protein [Leptolyngbya sp. CCNP1308]MEA5447331.1 hypothetical protein [Leptolyngbya sp. CCNP1308]